MAFTLKYAQVQADTLAGSGASIGDTTIVLTSFKTIDGVNLAMTDFGSKCFCTIEPNAGTQEEQITFSGLTQNGNGTCTLTGVKTVLNLYPHTETSGLAKAHAGGVKFVVSNTSGFQQSIIDYINGIAIAGAPVATPAVSGIAKLSTAAVDVADPIVVGDNDLRIATVSLATVTANEVAALAGTGTPNGTTGKYVTLDSIPGYATGPIVRTYTSGSGTWTKPSNLKYIIVEVQGAGESGQREAGTINAGADSTFKTLTGKGGGTVTANVGGLATGGDINVKGTSSDPCIGIEGTTGGNSFFGGGGKGSNVYLTGGATGVYGSGGGGAHNNHGVGGVGNGGAAGGYARKLFLTGGLSATESYAVGAGGAGSGGSANQGDSGSGGDGIVIVTEYYI